MSRITPLRCVVTGRMSLDLIDAMVTRHGVDDVCSIFEYALDGSAVYTEVIWHYAFNSSCSLFAR